MNCCPSRFFARLAFGAVLATACSTAAQQTILFSKPTETVEEKANSFMLEPASKLQGRAGEFNAPKPLFNFAPEPSLPPPELPTISSQSLRDALNKRKNWTLMTPEEILGVPTPEKILGLPDPTGDDKRTPEERYLRRQNLAAAISATNALRRPDLSLLHDENNPFAHRDVNSPFFKTDVRPEAGSRKYFDRLVNAQADSPLGANQYNNSAWSSSFDQPAPLPKPNLEQVAAMERFRAMMEPSAPPEKSPVATRFSPAPVTALDPDLQPMPQFNPLGQSYTPLQSGISRPTGILPLPSLIGPNTPPAPAKKSLVDLPPWLSDGPQPFGSPQRRF